MKRGVRTLIEVEHLTKRYGSHTAVDDISFTVEDGCTEFVIRHTY